VVKLAVAIEISHLRRFGQPRVRFPADAFTCVILFFAMALSNNFWFWEIHTLGEQYPASKNTRTLTLPSQPSSPPNNESLNSVGIPRALRTTVPNNGTRERTSLAPDLLPFFCFCIDAIWACIPTRCSSRNMSWLATNCATIRSKSSFYALNFCSISLL
jgi:hypothetical protein